MAYLTPVKRHFRLQFLTKVFKLVETFMHILCVPRETFSNFIGSRGTAIVIILIKFETDSKGPFAKLIIRFGWLFVPYNNFYFLNK